MKTKTKTKTITITKTKTKTMINLLEGLPQKTQSIATANAKLCKRQRKALHLLLQTFAVKVPFI